MACHTQASTQTSQRSSAAPTRTLTAPQSGPVLIDAQLLGAGGVVTVRTDPDRTNAVITIRTTDEKDDVAMAVRDADLRWDTRGALVAHVHGKGQGGTTIVNGGVFIAGNSFGVVQHVHTNYGSTVAISGGDLNFSGRAGVASLGTAIEIVAIVPEGSSVTARTQSASFIADGEYVAVNAATQSGDVRVTRRTGRVIAATQSGDVDVANSSHIEAKTQSGDILLGRTELVEARTMSGDIRIRDFGGDAKLQTMSGDIRVHATAGGDITAKTMSGDIEVTATAHAVDNDLDVRATTMSGQVQYPQRRQHGTGGPRRRRD